MNNLLSAVAKLPQTVRTPAPRAVAVEELALPMRDRLNQLGYCLFVLALYVVVGTLIG